MFKRLVDIIVEIIIIIILLIVFSSFVLLLFGGVYFHEKKLKEFLIELGQYCASDSEAVLGVHINLYYFDIGFDKNEISLYYCKNFELQPYKDNLLIRDLSKCKKRYTISCSKKIEFSNDIFCFKQQGGKVYIEKCSPSEIHSLGSYYYTDLENKVLSDSLEIPGDKILPTTFTVEIKKDKIVFIPTVSKNG